MPQHVLVTGGAGYVGSTLCAVLLESGLRVTAVDRILHGHPSLLALAHHPAFEFVNGDARNRPLIEELAKDADVVIPLAAVVGATACDQDPGRARSTNLDAIRLLAKVSPAGALMIYPTTNSGYGTTSGETHCTEDTPMNPITLYGRTKVEAEQVVLERPLSISLRLATVFGVSPRMRLDLLVNHFVHAAVTDGYLVVFEKDFKRNYVHVRDVADCFLHCIRNGSGMAGRPYNLGLDEANLSKEELANLIREHVPGFYIHFAEIGTDPDRRNYIVSNERLRRAGFEARRTLQEGIRELIKGYRMMGHSPFRNA